MSSPGGFQDAPSDDPRTSARMMIQTSMIRRGGPRRVVYKLSLFRLFQRGLVVLFASGVLWNSASAVEPKRSQGEVDFNRDIQPILADACFNCHGPDEMQRTSDLRLDTKDGALLDLGGYRAVVPGDVRRSELISRITSTDAEMIMPPSDSGLRLGPEQTSMLRRWIEQGAKWSQHWAFVPPQLLPPPRDRDSAWRRNAIDDFVLARLKREQLTPQQPAVRTTLIRRLSLGLTGLPPSLSEIDAFLADESPQAYEALVDRLLDSPHYGEHMAVAWLDAARYADTSGYQNDGPRSMWRWRDWVIESYNDNMPFDQFTIEQIAGDLLDKPPSETRATDYKSAWRGQLIRDEKRLDHLIATAFNRNHRSNAEGGIIPEEFQVEYVVDRVDTTSTVWLGLTLSCCRCHDHKYDPLTQNDFYSVYAYFNNVPEYGRAVKEGNSPPFIKAPTRKQRKQLAELEAQLKRARRAVVAARLQLTQEQQAWESKPGDDLLGHQAIVRGGLVARFAFEKSPPAEDRERAAKFVGSGESYAEGRVGRAAHFDGSSHLDAGDFADFGYFDKFTISAWIRPESPTGTIVSKMTPESHGDGYALGLHEGRVQVNLVKRWLDDSIRVETEAAVPLTEWTHVAAVYDGSREPTGVKVYLNGKRARLTVKQNFINQSFAAKEQPVRIGGGGTPFHGAIDDVRIYSRDLTARNVAIISTADSLATIVSIEPPKRTTGQEKKLGAYFLRRHASEPLKQLHSKLYLLQTARRDLVESIPTLMVMQEARTPRSTRILTRGEYDKPGAAVQPGIPKAFRSPADEARSSRVDLARWLVDPQNPLTARVAVNRLWQMHFGVGLVETNEDFGIRGSRPSHPQLLDWMAAEFIRSGWNVKRMQKLIAMSATYRQSSVVSAERLAADPSNRLLSRGARFRLTAETVRDQALAVSGLLTRRIGGPSVRPYQPAGLWKEIATDTQYDQSHGDDLYRRSLYTYWKRTVAPPTMSTLDAPPRDACTVKRSRTNTPLQALVLMNEVSFVEAARVLAQRSHHKGGETSADRLRFIFRSATSRDPSDREAVALASSLKRFLREFADNKSAAKQLVATGEHPLDKEIEVAELAAYTLTASLILNLDEVINRE